MRLSLQDMCCRKNIPNKRNGRALNLSQMIEELKRYSQTAVERRITERMDIIREYGNR